MTGTDRKEFSGFHKLSSTARLELPQKVAGLDGDNAVILEEGLKLAQTAQADWLENQVSAFLLPLSIVPNFVVNGQNYLVPMATEEAGIVAACTFAAKSAARNGGFVARMVEDRVMGQVVCYSAADPHEAVRKIESAKADLIMKVNAHHKSLTAAGGGLCDFSVRIVPAGRNEYIAITLSVDCRDAMGAALVTTMAEELAALLQQRAGCEVLLRVISNDMDHRLCECVAVFEVEDIGGLEVAERIVRASEYASVDPQRAITHNKGILNGMIAFTTAAGNDSRAVESAAHYYSFSSGKCLPLSRWSLEGTALKGVLRVPAALGSVGGATRASRINRACYRILGTESGTIVRQICAAVGLAANLGVLRALVTTGIGKSHRKK
jgi:hydroxymethylglutaryl-CoA reductase